MSISSSTCCNMGTETIAVGTTRRACPRQKIEEQTRKLHAGSRI